MDFDVIIIGLGPAGAAAAVYCARAGLSAVVFEGYAPGGQVSTTDKIENYPGFTSVEGFELATKFAEQTKASGAVVKFETVTSVDLGANTVANAETSPTSETSPNVKTVVTAKGTYHSRAMIICGGAKRRKLGIPDEDRLVGRGLSYCAVCDGGFYRGKTVAVVGGGDTAVGDAVYLSRLCEKVYLIHRRDTFRAAKSKLGQLDKCANVEKVLNSQVSEVLTDGGRVSGVKLGSGSTLTVDGVFVAVGTVPDTEMYALERDKSGYIVTNERMETSVPLVYAAGDIRAKEVRQIITAASDGAIAAVSCAEKLDAE